MFSLFMVIFWIALAGTIVFAVVRFRKYNEHNTKHSANQIDFIKSQYDKGELDKAQYEKLIRDLTK